MRYLMLIVAAAGTLTPTMLHAADRSEDARFAAIAAKEYAWRKLQFASADDVQNHIPAHLPDDGPDAQIARTKVWADVAAQLATIAPARLSAANRDNLAIYRQQIDTLRAWQRFRDYEKPLTADSSFWSDLAEIARGNFRTETDYRHYLSMLHEMPRYFAQQIVNMRAGLARGFTPPKVTLAGRETGVATVVEAKTPQDNIFYAPFVTMPAAIPAATQAALRAAAVTAIRDDVVPAHRALRVFLRDDYIPHAQPALGADALPDGRAYYQAKIAEFTTLALTPEQIHAIGLKEIARIHAEMLAVMREVKFTGDLPAFLAFLRTDPQFYAKTPQDLLDRAAWIAKTFDGKAKLWFGRLPRSRFAIKPVPAEIAPFYTSGRGGPGVYLVNTYDLRSRALYSLPALTLHESAPGHAFQIPLAAENTALPAYRKENYISAYGEGWALYCERLGVEMGMYDTPYDRFGMLSYQAWRASRLVVDTGIHTKGWSRARAQAYLHDNTALADHEIETEVDRYISWPGQALSYYLGEMAIVEARAKAENALGPKFNIRAFHDTVLQLGSVPLPVLTARIDRFIADGGKGPYPDEE